MNRVIGVGVASSMLLLLFVALAQQPASNPLPARDLGLELELKRTVNAKAITPSADLSKMKGLMCTVHVTAPEPNVTSGKSWGRRSSGANQVNDRVVGAVGVLTEVSERAIVITGPNGHVWIPLGQVVAVEFVQNPSTGVD